MTEALSTATLADRCRSHLAQLLPATFRYYKTAQHFREPFDGGVAYLTINAVTPGRGVYHLAFYFGTRVDALEDRISEVFRGRPRTPSHDERSITCYSVNLGPESRHWPYPFRPDWSFESLDGYAGHAPQIERFVAEVALPFLRQHRTPEAVRETLLRQPGHAINLEPYKAILAASLLHGDRARLLEDIAELKARYAAHVERYRSDFERACAQALAAL